MCLILKFNPKNFPVQFLSLFLSNIWMKSTPITKKSVELQDGMRLNPLMIM